MDDKVKKKKGGGGGEKREKRESRKSGRESEAERGRDYLIGGSYKIPSA